MSKGDVSDILTRLKTLLPAGWFGDETPKLDSLLSACATSLSWGYSLYQYARLQTRISTASGSFLDIAARDFFGARLRRTGEDADDVFRHKIRTSLFRQRGTRQAVISLVEELTGLPPTIIETQRPGDTGGYGISTSGYGMAGHYGSWSIPCQAFVIVHRSVKPESIQGSPQYVMSAVSGHSAAENDNIMMSSGTVSDTQIYAAIAEIKTLGTIVWVRVE